jgi:hypothetical protein
MQPIIIGLAQSALLLSGTPLCNQHAAESFGKWRKSLHYQLSAFWETEHEQLVLDLLRRSISDVFQRKHGTAAVQQRHVRVWGDRDMDGGEAVVRRSTALTP